MDDSEKLVDRYLKNIGFADVRYEPDGNVPPDFLADARVAVEVRRLNQHYDNGSGKGSCGLEEVSIPLWHHVHDYLTGLGPASASGESWYVLYRFSRPTPNWKVLKRELDTILLPFMQCANPQPFGMKLNVSGEFYLKVFPSTIPKTTFFRPVGHTDEQSGGFLIDEIDISLQHCIAEKTAKITKYKAKYPEWWLVFADHIGYGLDDFEQNLFLAKVKVQNGPFDKIIIIDPRDATRVFQAYP